MQLGENADVVEHLGELLKRGLPLWGIKRGARLK